MLQTDNGSEFINSTFQEMLKRKTIHFYTSNTDTKPSICERFSRTLKTKLFKYFTHRKTWRYIDILPDISESYTYHRSIKMAPNEVNETTEDVVRKRLYSPKSIKNHDFNSKWARLYAFRELKLRSLKLTKAIGLRSYLEWMRDIQLSP